MSTSTNAKFKVGDRIHIPVRTEDGSEICGNCGGLDVEIYRISEFSYFFAETGAPHDEKSNHTFGKRRCYEPIKEIDRYCSLVSESQQQARLWWQDLKVGDKVKLIVTSEYYRQMHGWGKISRMQHLETGFSDVDRYYFRIEWENGDFDFYRPCDLDPNQIIKQGSSEPVLAAEKPEPKTMQKLTSKLRRFLRPSQKIQYRAGFIDDCNNLTSKGREELELILREAYKSKLVEAAKLEIAEEEKEQKDN